MHPLTRHNDTVAIEPLTADALGALRAGDRATLEAATGAVFPTPLAAPPLFDEDLVVFEERVRTTPDDAPWWVWLIMEQTSRAAVGVVGLGGRPDGRGVVTVGYSVYPASEGRGYATAATRLLLEWIEEQPEVDAVEATIPPRHIPSIRVAEKAGLRPTMESRKSEVGPVLVYRRLVNRPPTPGTRARMTGGAIALLVAAIGALSLLPADLAGQGRRPRNIMEIGIRAGYDFQVDDAMLGGQLRFGLPRGTGLVASGDWIFGGGTNFQMNLDLLLPLGPNGGLYAGGGLGAAVVDRTVPGGNSDVSLGGNLLVGLAPYRWGRRGPHWFVEARWFLHSGDDPFRLLFGLTAPIGGY